ncbi:MAG: DUF21 domain-containing protein [Clostridia bacterium]
MEKKSNNEKPKILKKKIEEKPKKRISLWPIQICVLTFFLALFFSVSSEFLLSKTGIIVSSIIILFLIFVSVMADMVGVAVTAASFDHINAMAARRIRGAKESVVIVSNSEKFASFCNDVVGDVCGIISGAAGSVIVIKIFEAYTPTGSVKILIAALISGLIASLTVFTKAIGKKVAIANSESIVMKVGKFLSLFSKKN